jgi:hypothetical protein
MRTSNIKAAVTSIVVGAALAACGVTGSHARLQESAEPAAPGAQQETIYRPVCWMEDGSERWVRCAAVPGDEVEPHVRGGYYAPRSRRY